MTLYFITGCMHAGKSSALQSIQTSLDEDMYDTYRPAFDTPRGDKLSLKAKKILSVADITSTKPIVFFDEVQFFTEPLFDGDFVSIIKGLSQIKDVYCAGLDRDYKGEPFKVSDKLLGVADEVMILYANCDICGGHKQASRTIKIGGDIGKTFEVGSDIYSVVCEKCYKNLEKFK